MIWKNKSFQNREFKEIQTYRVSLSKCADMPEPSLLEQMMSAVPIAYFCYIMFVKYYLISHYVLFAFQTISCDGKIVEQMEYHLIYC